jgi:hypothetical protein
MKLIHDEEALVGKLEVIRYPDTGNVKKYIYRGYEFKREPSFEAMKEIDEYESSGENFQLMWEWKYR